MNVVSVITGHPGQAALSDLKIDESELDQEPRQKCSHLPQLGGTEGARAVEVVVVEPVPLLQSLELVSYQAPEGWTQYRP